MKAIVMSDFGGPEVLSIGEVAAPQLHAGTLRVAVQATALNRADLLQRRGKYPPPPGASQVLGLEMAGRVVEIGEGVRGWKVGERVCALLPGGGYAEQVVIPAEMAIRLPDHFSYEQGAAIPEAFLTAYLNLVWLGGLSTGKTVLVHAGASGVGTAAIQLIRELAATSVITAGSEEKIVRCLELGAKAGWNYKQGSFSAWVQEQTEGRGVDLILDFIGAPYFEQNLASLAVDGRLMIIGTMGGDEVERISLGYLLARRLQVIGTALRSRSTKDKGRLTAEFVQFALPRFESGRIRPVMDRVFDWSEAGAAHAYMETNANVGKIVLRVNGGGV